MNTQCDPRQLAVDLLARSVCSVQVGAVLSDRHGIFSWGWNFPIVSETGTHAEQHAFLRANRKRLRGATLTVAGQRRKQCGVSSGPMVYAKPCQEICLPLAKKHGIDKIQFRNKLGEWEELRLRYVPA